MSPPSFTPNPDHPEGIIYPPPAFSGAAQTTILQPLKPGEVRAPKPRGRPRTKVQPVDLQSTFPDSTVIQRPGQAPGGVGPQQRITPQAPAPKQESEAEKKARLKNNYNKRVDELQAKIVTEFNSQLLQALMVVGIPGNFLFKEGSIPAKAVENSPYTPLGQALTLNPYQADWIAHGIVEVEKVEWVKKLNLTYDPEKPSYFWIGMAGLGSISYIGGMLSAVSEMRKMVNELKNLQKLAGMGPPSEPEYNGPAFSESGPI